MQHSSHDEQALIKIQHEWVAARLKRDSSFPQRIAVNDYTEVWVDGRIAHKEEYLKSFASAETVFTDFKIDDLRVRLYGDTAIVVGQGSIKVHTKTQDLSGKYVWTDTFVKVSGDWKAIASQVSRVLEK